MNDSKVSLKGFSITRESLEQRFGVKLNPYEWAAFKKRITESWESREFELERVIVKHIRGSLESLDYKAELLDGRLKFSHNVDKKRG